MGVHLTGNFKAHAFASLALILCASSPAVSAETYSTITPPRLNGSVANFGNIFTSCGFEQFLTPAIKDLGRLFNKEVGSKEGGFSIDSPCPVGDAVPSDLSCPKYMVNGEFQMSIWKADEKAIGEANGALSCKIGKLEAIKGELECFKKGSQMLEQQIAALQGEYTRNIQRMSTEVSQMNTYIGERERQMGEIDGKLKGIGALKKEAKALVDAARAQIEAFRKRINISINERAKLEKDAKMRTMALTNQCVKEEAIPGLQCKVNGVAVTVGEWAACAVEQYSKVGPDGRTIEKNPEMDAKASQRKADLIAELNRIFANSPNDPEVIVMNGESAQSKAPQPSRYLSPDNIDWRRFDRFNISGPGLSLRIRQMIEKKFRSCYRDREAQVQKERQITSGARGGADSPLAYAAKAIETAESETKASMNALLTEYSVMYQQMNSALTGTATPLNTVQCEGAAPKRQLACLEDGFKMTDDLLQGKSPGSEQNMVFQATMPQMNVPIKCRGLMGCETALTNAMRNLGNDRQKVVENKKKYIQSANQQIQSFTEQMRTQFSGQTAYLRENLQKINLAFNGLGETGLGIRLDNMEREDLQPQPPDGLMGSPQDILKLIGGGTKPPMISMDAFSSSIGGIGSTVERLEDRKKAIVDAKSKHALAKSTCTKEEVEAALERLQTQVNAFTSAKCNLNERFCDPNAPKDRLTELVSSVSDVGMQYGSDALQSIQATLSGISCDEGATEKDRQEADIVSKYQGLINQQRQFLVNLATAKDEVRKPYEDEINRLGNAQRTETDRVKARFNSQSVATTCNAIYEKAMLAKSRAIEAVKKAGSTSGAR